MFSRWALIAICMQMAVVAQAQWGGRRGGDRDDRRPGIARVCFYQDGNYSGGSFCLGAGQEATNLAQSGWNDKISSISIDGDAVAYICGDAFFSGPCISIDRSTPFMPGGWNDIVSSIRIVTGHGGGGGGGHGGGGGGGHFNPPTPPAPPARGRICFYQDTDFKGGSFCMGPGDEVTNLSQSGWNDKISSISVEGGVSATVCWDAFYSGSCINVNRSMSNLWNVGGRNWNDTISSIRVQGGFGGGPGRR